MPGINQLGGALSTTAAPSTPANAEGNQSSNAQSDAGLQVASSDGVKGVSNAKETDGDAGGRNRRDFAELASRRRGTDPKTGDVVNVGQKVNKAAAARALGETGQSSAAKERLSRSLEDLFAPRPRAQQAQRQAPVETAKAPVEAAQALAEEAEAEDVNETDK